MGRTSFVTFKKIKKVKCIICGNVEIHHTDGIGRRCYLRLYEGGVMIGEEGTGWDRFKGNDDIKKQKKDM